MVLFTHSSCTVTVGEAVATALAPLADHMRRVTCWLMIHGRMRHPGGRGILAEEEQRLYNLRVEREGEARTQILAEREKFEEEARSSQVGTMN